MIVLIITKTDDNECIDMVSEAVKAEGGEAFRFDTDRFPTEIRLIARYYKGSEQLKLISDGGELDLREVTAVWHRRLNIAGLLPKTIDPQIRHACLGESRSTVSAMLASLKVFRMDQLQNIRHAENKQLQLQVARELGLEIPRTLISNDPEAVRRFAADCEGRVITKMLSSFAIYEEGLEKVVFTNPVSESDLNDLDGLRFCPMTFQEMVPKAVELRVTIVGTQIFSASIDSGSSARAAYDWRRDGVGLLDEWASYQLPVDVSEKLLRVMDYFGLNYGAADFIVTPDGRHVFLEVNPVGEFFWLERRPGLPISRAIAKVLLGKSARRERAAFEASPVAD